MKVAFCIRPDYDNPLGGDAIQMLKTKEYLERNYDVEVDILTKSTEIHQKYDIVHVFNFSTYRDTSEFIKKAKLQHLPIVSSPIFWDYTFDSTKRLFYLLKFKPYLEERTILKFRKLMRFVGYIYSRPLGVSRKFKRYVEWMFEKSDIVAPNSIEEGNLLLSWIDEKSSEKIRIVYNATDIGDNQNATILDEEEFLKKYSLPKDYILQVGRVEYCKNQLNLVAGLMQDPEIPIVFVGRIVDDKYFGKLKKISDKRGNVFFINAIPNNEISSFYKFAKLHVLLSLRESPGLVNIEALANECPIVISDERFLPVRTYFSNQPYIVNPLDINEIRNVVLNAYNNRKISPFDFQKFSWENVAKQTYSIYQELITNMK